MKPALINRRGAETPRANRKGSFFSAPLRLCGEMHWGGWLPDMDSNHDKQIQSLLCYRYTIGQGTGAEDEVLMASVKSEQFNTL